MNVIFFMTYFPPFMLQNIVSDQSHKSSQEYELSPVSYSFDLNYEGFFNQIKTTNEIFL